MSTSQDTEAKLDPLDKEITNLFLVCNEIQDRYCESNKQQPYWSTCANKLHASYVKVNNSGAYRDMFLTFHQKYSRHYCISIFGSEDGDDDENVNDDFFKSLDLFTTPGAASKEPAKTATKKGGSSWSKKPVLKGPVIYYTYEDERAAGVCLPIGEIYRVTIGMFEEMERKKGDDMDIRSLPARLLSAFYRTIYEACGESCEGAAIIKNNIEMLDQAVSEVTIHTNEEAASSGPFGVLKDMFKKVVPALTKGGKDSLLPKEAQTVIENVIKGDTIDEVGNMFATISTSIQNGAEKAKQEGKVGSVSVLLESISETLKTEPVVNTMQNIAGKLSTLTGEGILAPPTVVPTPVDSSPGNDAGDQC